MDKLINIALVICIFFTLSSVPTPLFDFYYYYIIIVFLLPYLFFKNKTTDIKLILVFSAVLFFGLVNVLLSNTTLVNTIKYWLGPFVVYLFYYHILVYKKFDFENIFRIYLSAAFWISLLGIVQVISHKIGFEIGYNFSWLGQERSFGDSISSGDIGFSGLYNLHSILPEPAHFGNVMSCAIFYSVFTLVKPVILNKIQAIVILTASVLTQSSVTYFSIVVSVLLLVFNFARPKYIIVAGIVLFISGGFIFNSVKKFQDRVLSINKVATDGVDSSIADGIDGSTLTLVNHGVIAIENMKQHPMIGTGIGSHEFAHAKYSLLGNDLFMNSLNIHDASSLFNRILSEMGLLGIVSLVLFLFYNFVKRNDISPFTTKNTYWMYNNGSLVVILSFLLRNGHFFIYGLPLFVLTYYYTKKILNDEIQYS